MASRGRDLIVWTAALVCLLAGGPAEAYRDNCFRTFGPAPAPSVFGGIDLPDHGRDAAFDLAFCLGIRTVSCREPNGWWMEGAQLGATALRWTSQSGIEHGTLLGLPTTVLRTIIGRQQDWGCTWYRHMTADQPAGATRIVRATAVVPDLDRFCKNAQWDVFRASYPASFGPAFDVPELGARARDLTLEHGALRVMEPATSDGLADQWLRRLGPGWIGFAVEVADGLATRAVLERRGIRVLSPRHGGPSLLVADPESNSGLLVEYVTAPVP